MKQKREWFHNWFDETYLKVYSNRNEQEAETFIEWIQNRYNFQASLGIADIACGAGRHSFALANKYNFNVMSLDLSRPLLEAGLIKADGEHQTNPFFIQGDIRNLPFRENSFGLVLNVFTSFGYFEDDDIHINILKEFRKILKEDGIIIIDLLNKSWLKNTIKPYSEDMIDEMKIIQKRRITDNDKFVKKEIVIKHPEMDDRIINESVRLFEQDEFKSFLENTGLIVENIVGNYDGSTFHSINSPRMIFCLRKES